MSLRVGVGSRYRVDGTQAGVCVHGGFRLLKANPDGSHTVLHQQPIGACHQSNQQKHRHPRWAKQWKLEPDWPVEDLVFEVRGFLSIDCFAPSDELAIATVQAWGHDAIPSIEWDCYHDL
ncbi:MAG: hypothetical protein ACI9K2_005798 [Myxococcota bacterium]